MGKSLLLEHIRHERIIMPQLHLPQPPSQVHYEVIPGPFEEVKQGAMLSRLGTKPQHPPFLAPSTFPTPHVISSYFTKSQDEWKPFTSRKILQRSQQLLVLKRQSHNLIGHLAHERYFFGLAHRADIRQLAVLEIGAHVLGCA